MSPDGWPPPSETVRIRPASRPTMPSRGATLAAMYGAAIAAAELSGSVFGAIPGAVFDAALAAALLIQFIWRPHAEGGRLLPALALVALIRPVSLAAALPTMQPLAWYVFAGLPLLVGAALAVRLVEEPAWQLHLRIKRPWLDASVAAAGVPTGLVCYFLLQPSPLLAPPSPVGYASMAAILLVFGGGLEELIFRGLVQSAAVQVVGNPLTGVAFTAALNMALYWGSGSIPYMLLMGVLGATYGLALLRGASLWGVALSHGLILVTLALLTQALTR
jgi:membrane protease YdiL (CAAX protease family)